MRRAFIVAILVLAAASARAQECLDCHDTVDPAKLAASVHAPLGCTDCHSDAATIPHETKPKTERADIPRMCSRCHAQKFVMEKAGLSTQSAVSYQESVHGRAVARGSAKAAVCTACHDSHEVRRANDPQSGIFKFNVGRTCGKCHAAIANEYSHSIHGKALARGNWTTPVCTDCHGIHTIAKASDPTAGPRTSCARCHDGVRLTKEFGVPGTRVSSWKSSYHGLARRMGSTVAADCASCHGAHNVLPSSDRRSAVHPANLPKTCGSCHPGVNANFARGKIHVARGDVSDTPSRINTWIGRIYTVVIVVTIGLMLLHNFLLWFRKARAARLSRGQMVVRMNLNQRIQHGVMVVSFIVLVISGFALAWPESIFAWPFGPSETLRRLVHRAAAVVMIILGLYHLGYMTLTREGRQGLRDFWFRVSDARELGDVLRNRRAQSGRFGYAEKIEYWAGLWGTLVMAITGLVIWSFTGVATWVPRWWIDIAMTIHFYEAILATLAIVVWHLYHVIFDPDVYPMNWAWFDGKKKEE